MMQCKVLTTIAMAGLLAATLGATEAALSCPSDQQQRGTDEVAGVVASEELGNVEKRELLRMQQEEKMARDVYLEMFDVHRSRIFENISKAEQRHMSAIADQIEKFGLQNPIEDDSRGVFVDPAFDKLYKELVDDGTGSLVDALMVGARIEEMDIADLRAAVEATSNRELIRVYENLLRASRNHLRAFASRLAAMDKTYDAEFLTQEDFDSIASSPKERGRGVRKRNGRNQVDDRQGGERRQEARRHVDQSGSRCPNCVMNRKRDQK